MNVIYEPKGKAYEYCKLAANLYKGCGHGCLYCYAPDATFALRETFHGNPTPRPDILRKLQADVFGFETDSPILLSFTSDPYQPAEQQTQLTRHAISILKTARLKVSILSKGGLRATRDFDLLGPGDEVGATLTFTDPAMSREWEPGAAPPLERIKYLRAAHDRGLKTWVSLEPVIDPRQSLELIDLAHQYVDTFKVGILNHHPKAKEIDWRDFGLKAVSMLERLGSTYYVKKDLQRWMA